MNLTREDALSFVNILNSFQPYVPPMMFNGLNGHPVSLFLLNVANAPMEVAEEPEAKKPAPGAKKGK